MVDDLLPHQVSSEHRHNFRHKTSHHHWNENPVNLINGLFYWAPENVVGMVSMCGRSDRLAALSAWFEVLFESKVVWTPGGQKRSRRTREIEFGGVCANLL